ncbi:uncharacterized protein LOC120454629 isoform X2 [Drosophila santomea]|uniref:uncharacterized protein LOC120454629 isoform X2 n=1 Tax=Drosophila santomea TaxID=129105 RepID=UPI00195359D7|nr:uncharacterized protein LOC120454629 isoform X2 [Drosophila santomea]
MRESHVLRSTELITRVTSAPVFQSWQLIISRFCVYFFAVAGSRQPTNHNNSDHNNTNRATVAAAPATTTRAFRHGLCLGLRPTNPPFSYFRRLLLLLL